MKNLPEKLYVIADEENIAKRGLFDSEKTFKNDIEYVRSDIAKEFALQFSKQLIDAKVDLYSGARKDLSIDELFDEFINSRKK